MSAITNARNMVNNFWLGKGGNALVGVQKAFQKGDYLSRFKSSNNDVGSLAKNALLDVGNSILNSTRGGYNIASGVSSKNVGQVGRGVFDTALSFLGASGVSKPLTVAKYSLAAGGAKAIGELLSGKNMSKASEAATKTAIRSIPAATTLAGIPSFGVGGLAAKSAKSSLPAKVTKVAPAAAKSVKTIRPMTESAKYDIRRNMELTQRALDGAERKMSEAVAAGDRQAIANIRSRINYLERDLSNLARKTYETTKSSRGDLIAQLLGIK